MTVHKPLGETLSQGRGRLEFEERVKGRNLIEGGPLRETEGKPTSRAQRTHKGDELRSGKQVARPSGAQEARYLKERQKVKRECRDDGWVKPAVGRSAEQPGAKLRG